MKLASRLLPIALIPMATLLSACAHVHVDPIEVKPIHIVHDINIRVDKQLDDFFAFERAGGASATTQATSQPTTAPAPSPTTTTASNHS